LPVTDNINQARTGRPSVPVFSAGPETRWPIPRADTAGPDAHSQSNDGWNPAGLKGEPVAMAFTLPEGGRGTFKPTHHQESHGLSIPGKQP